MSDEDYFTFGNVGEVMPEVMTPLSLSVVIPSFEKGSFNNIPMAREPQFFNQAMAMSHNRVAINVFSAFLQVVDREISMANRVNGLSAFGHEYVTDEIHQIAVHRKGVVSKSTQFWYILQLIKCAWTGEPRIKKLEGFMEKLKGDRRNPRMFQSLREIYESIAPMVANGLPYVQSVHGLSSMMCSFYQIIMFSALGEGKTEFTAEYLADITALLSSCKDAESAEIPTSLEEIASIIRSYDSSKAQEFCDISPEEGFEWLKNNCIEAHTRFESFVERHAHRGYQEVIKFYAPQPFSSLLMSSVRNSLTSDMKPGE